MISEKHAHHFSSWTKERLAKIDATGALPSNPTAAGFKDVQDRKNASGFYRKAKHTPQDIVTLQTQFVQDRMQALVPQTQQLFTV